MRQINFSPYASFFTVESIVFKMDIQDMHMNECRKHAKNAQLNDTLQELENKIRCTPLTTSQKIFFISGIPFKNDI